MIRVVTDSAAGLPADIVEELGISVVDLHVMESHGKDGAELSTSGLTALELAALYGREMERSGDDGVLAIHLSKELSSTWSAAVTASGVFPDTVRVIDSGTAGMVMGAAAMTAAKLAQDGASLTECYEGARDTLERGHTWVYLNSTEDLRRSGRMSAATAMLSTALLATKPIMAVQAGKLEMVGKTRTQTKAFTKLVDLVASRAEGKPAFVAVQYNDNEAAARRLEDLLRMALPESSFMRVALTDVLSVHVGPGAIGVSVVFS
ncbi:DegV family protein [Corynebacterium sp. BF-R-2]|uniref:DegV family protein n=1 Tax=Corynebacterium sp. BF-R-2 TaxID=2943494 RepID=UPI00211F3D18|nr:DegV family protein [Corynebacterium sp. BF-R-2]MCQ9676752.1 DegV family protein [Corynebacterium sp. BF-R-2]